MFLKTLQKQLEMGKGDKLFELYDQYKGERSGENKHLLLEEAKQWKKKNKCPYQKGEALLDLIILESFNVLAKEMIGIGFGINNPSNTGRYPIYHAVYMDNIEMVLLLLDNGADINTPERQQQNTPLHIALKRPEVTRCMVSFLVKRGQTVNKRIFIKKTHMNLKTNRQQKSKQLSC